MKTFRFTAQVERTVVDTISLKVAADNATQAYKQAEQLLMDFPAPAEKSGVKYCYIENREPREIRILTIDREIDG